MYIECDWFSAEKIHESGQCFRWVRMPDGSFDIPAFGLRLNVKENGLNAVSLSCSESEYNEVWRSYFDMDFDYKSHAEKACSLIGSDYLAASARISSGIRILRQELWETTVSFIISANNNIPRIRKILSAICGDSGAFPSAADILNMGADKLRECGTGYRDKYLMCAAEFFQEHNVETELKGLNYANIKKYLMQIKGVGSKVADCISLFSLNCKDAFPRDVHIKRIETEHFGGRFPEELSLGGAGILQQYMFYYERVRGLRF